MNPKSFKKVLKTLDSCKTRDQYVVFMEWIFQLRKLYNFSMKQNLILNDKYMEHVIKVTRGEVL